MSTKLVLKSTTSSSLNDRFSKLMKNRPDDSARPTVDTHGSLRPGSDRNRKLAEQLERKNGPEIRRKPLSHRIGDIGQGGARTLAAALQSTRGSSAGYNTGGRVGKRLGPLAGRIQQPRTNHFQSQQSSNEANRALKKAQNMLRETERELAMLKRQKATKITQNKLVRNGGARGGQRGGGGGARGAGRGRGRGRGGSRGGGAQGNKGGKPKSAEALDAELDRFMLGTKGGLDKEMDEYMSSTKNGLDKQMEDYMAAKKA